jgi:hypothetical protein
MPIPTVSDTYTGAGGPTQDTYDKLAASYASQIRGAPQVKQQLGADLMANEGSIEPLADERAKMIEKLYSADKDLGAQYSAPTSSSYIESPLAAQQAISGAEAPMWRGIEKLNTVIGARKQVLGDALQRGMEIYQTGLEAKKVELDNMQKTLERLNAKALAESQMAAQAAAQEQAQKNWEKEFGLKQYEAMTKAAGAGAMSKDAISELSQINGAQAAIDDLEAAYMEMEKEGGTGAHAVYASKLAGIQGADFYPAINNYKALATSYVLPLNFLTGIDTKSAGGNSSRLFGLLQGVLPNEYTHPAEARRLFQYLRQKVANKSENAYTLYKIKPSFDPYAYAGVKKPAYAMSPEYQGYGNIPDTTTTPEVTTDYTSNPDDWEEIP